MSVYMMFLILLFAHLLADYPLQGDFLANMKGKNLIILATHAGIWTGAICIALWLMNILVTPIDIVWLFVVHAIADYMKAKPLGFYKKLNPLGAGLAIDQGVHILQIIILLTYKTI
ncbi:DUF3307 domain-containing protein [Bacillus haynesii]|uniref:DUF3307 domain-containing protein n=1 Tax=Bacillus haynesii TaxID=1925021 RepID=UPI0022821F69|nr:DUF3307 domain-containing protein [Bacillus haynesii]MCY8549422.1 DUF3307 domain-containing protein [Bacillus haynesii]